MQSSHTFRAWKWLFPHLVIAALIGYLSTLLAIGLGLSAPSTILKATSFGLPHVGGLIVDRGIAFGLDEGLIIFSVNLTVALLFVALVYWARLLNPHNQSWMFSRLRKQLHKDHSVDHLRKIPPFSHIQSPQLLLTSFLLLGVPYIATITLGLLAGTLLGFVHMVTSSPLLALAYIMPHGMLEIPALLLACSIPVGTWMAIRPVVGNESSSASFRRIDRVLSSQQFQKNMKMIINLLLIAGLIEAHFTLKVVAMFSDG